MNNYYKAKGIGVSMLFTQNEHILTDDHTVEQIQTLSLWSIVWFVLEKEVHTKINKCNSTCQKIFVSLANKTQLEKEVL